MTVHNLTLGQNIQTAITAGSAGDTYNFAAGIYRGQQFTPKAGDFYNGAVGGGTTLSGASIISSWTNVSANWFKATQGTTDLGGTANFPAPSSTWSGTATISGTTLTVVSTTSGAFSAPSGGASLYGNGIVAGTSVVSGSGTTWTISQSQTVASALPMILCNQNFENGGAFPNNPLAFAGEELFVDGARYTRIQAAATPVAPGAGQWFWDFSNSSVNINLATPTSHTIEYSQTQIMINSGLNANFTLNNMTIEKFSGFQQAAILNFPSCTQITFNNVTGQFCKGPPVNVAGGVLRIWGGHYNDNAENGIIGSPNKAIISGAEVARNNAALDFSAGNQASGIKFTLAVDTTIQYCYVHGNGGPGIWFDVYSIRSSINNNTSINNSGPGIAYEISVEAEILNNTVTGGNNTNIDGLCGIFISNSSDVEVAGNNVTVGLGNDRVGGGICALNVGRGSSFSNGPGSFSGSISGSTLTAGTVTGSIVLPARLYGSSVLPGVYIEAQLTGSAGATGTYQLSSGHPTVAAEAMLTAFEVNNVLSEARNLKIHHNTITYPSVTGAMDAIAIDQAIVGGSTNYRDWNTYYTPNSTGTFWYRSTDAGVDTSYTFAAYQAAGFEPNSVNIVGLSPALSPIASVAIATP